MAQEQSEEIKQEAREFMSGLVGSGDNSTTTGTPPTSSNDNDGRQVDMAAWKSLYDSSTKDEALMEQFWSKFYDPTSTSIWRMVYDEPEYNENLEDTIQIAKDVVTKSESMKDHCFGIVHTLDSLEVEGIFFLDEPDPEKLFGANEDTSWFSWNVLDPERNDQHVKAAVAKYIILSEGELDGSIIQDTQVLLGVI